MLENIKTLDIKIPYMHDNADFRNNLKLLSPFFKLNFETATKEDYEMFFYNLLWLAKHDLSLAHCIHHNQKARVAIESSNSIIKDSLKKLEYHNVVGCYSGHRAIDTIRYDPITNTITSGTKNWLSNLPSADICVFEVAEINIPIGKSAYTDYTNKNVYVMYVDLSKIPHSTTDGTVSPTAAGMTGAAPGILTITESIKVDNISCAVLAINPRENKNPTWIDFARQCWATQHFGLILGLYEELRTYPELQDPGLAQRIKAIELEISNLKILWEYGLQTKMLTNTNVTQNPIMSNSSSPHFVSTQYASNKKVLLDLIYLVLEIGVNDFIDTNTEQWVKLNDAISFVTHMTSLHRCHSSQFGYNNL